MTEAALPDRDLLALLQAAEVAIGSAPNVQTSDLDHVRATLDQIERATPLGAILHARLDTVRKWLGVLAEPSELGRFGGNAHVRAHVLAQLKLVRGALADYRRAMP